MNENYCCPVRRHLLIGIVGERNEPMPVELADFIIKWEPRMIVAFKFCPFCGEPLKPDESLRVVDLKPKPKS